MNDKKQKNLRLAAGITSLISAACAILTIVLIFVVAMDRIKNGNSLGKAFLATLVVYLGIILAVILGVCAIASIIAGILLLTKGSFAVAAVMSITDFVAAIGIIIMTIFMNGIGAAWFFVFAIPFIGDAVTRIVCSAMNKRSETVDEYE